MKIARFAFLSFFFAVGILSIPSVSAVDDVRVRLELEAAEVYPGDVLEARFTVRSEELKRWTLVAPQSSSLRIIGEQAFPVQAREDSGYETSWVVVYQTMKSGEVSLAGGFVARAVGAEELRLPIEKRSLAVLDFGDLTDGDELEALPAELGASDSRSWWREIVGASVLLLAGAWLFRRSLARRAQVAMETSGSARDRFEQKLAALQSAGTLSREDAAHLLREYGSELSARSVERLSSLAYARSGDSQVALEALKEEVSS